MATPANWHHGEDVIIVPEMPDGDAKERFPEAGAPPLPYMHVVPDPSFGAEWFGARFNGTEAAD